jgi:hypothetical protein
METAVRITSIGPAFFGAVRRKSITGCGSSREERSFLERIELNAIGKLTMPEQMDCLLKAGVSSDFVDVIPSVNQDTLLAENITEAC